MSGDPHQQPRSVFDNVEAQKGILFERRRRLVTPPPTGTVAPAAGAAGAAASSRLVTPQPSSAAINLSPPVSPRASGTHARPATGAGVGLAPASSSSSSSSSSQAGDESDGSSSVSGVTSGSSRTAGVSRVRSAHHHPLSLSPRFLAQHGAARRGIHSATRGASAGAGGAGGTSASKMLPGGGALPASPFLTSPLMAFGVPPVQHRSPSICSDASAASSSSAANSLFTPRDGGAGGGGGGSGALYVGGVPIPAKPRSSSQQNTPSTTPSKRNLFESFISGARVSGGGSSVSGAANVPGGGVSRLLVNGEVDPYNAAVKLFYLATLRMRDAARHSESIVDKWRRVHPDLRDPSFSKSGLWGPHYYLVDDLLEEVVSWLPAVVLVRPAMMGSRLSAASSDLSDDDDAFEQPDACSSCGHQRVPYRYRSDIFPRYTDSLSKALASIRDGDLIAIRGSVFLPSTLTITQRCRIYGVKEADGSYGELSAGCAASYCMLRVRAPASVELSDLTLTGDTVLAVEQGSVVLRKCEVNGHIIQDAGKLSLTKTSIKAGAGKCMGMYGVYTEGGGELHMSHSSITGSNVGVKISGSTCTIKDCRISDAVNGGLMIRKGCTVSVERVDFKKRDSVVGLSPDIQVSAGAKQVTMLDSKVGPSNLCCVKILNEPVAAALSAGVVAPHGVCEISLCRNEFSAPTEAATCLSVPASPNLQLTVKENVFLSGSCAVTSRLVHDTSSLLLKDNMFEQCEDTALRHLGTPECLRARNNRFTQRELSLST